MAFPFGHHHQHHHHHHDGREEEEEARRQREQQYYPPPGHQPHPAGYAPGPAYPPVQHVAHEVRPGPYGREEETGGWGEGRQPHGRGDHGGPFSAVHHVSHESYGAGDPHRAGYEPGPVCPPVQHVAHEVTPGPQHYGPGGHGGPHSWASSFVHHGSHESSGSGGVPAHQRTVRIFTKAAENYSLSIRDGKVILARADHRDEYQHWIKDERFSTKVKDVEGLPSFALINKVTGQAIKHSIGATHPVRLIPYNGNYLDESILWTESHDTGEGFRCIRMVNNPGLNFDAFHGDEDHGGVRDGTIIVLWEWLKGKNQRWKIVPY